MTTTGDPASMTIPQARQRLFARLSLFRGLSDPVLTQIVQVARPQTWPEGLLLFHRGDPSTSMIVVESGHIRISLQTLEGREFVLQHVRGEAIVGEVGLLDAASRTADATVAAPTSGYVIDQKQFTGLMDRNPELAQAAIRHLCSLLRYTTDHIEALALYGLEARLARFLLASVDPSLDGEPKPSFVLDLSQSEIADLLGSSRPKVNQALIALERRGVITRDGHTITCDHQRLVRMAVHDAR